MAANVLLVLIVAQMAAIGVGAAIAVWEIESIVVSGPILSLIGLMIAARCAARGRIRGLYFGLAVPTISVVSFALINLFGWGPSAAQAPLGALLVAFAAASIPLGVFALREADGWANAGKQGPVQFRIATLLWLMLLVSLPLALYRAGPAGLALGVLAAYSLVLGFVLRRFHLRRAEVERYSQPSALGKPKKASDAPDANAYYAVVFTSQRTDADDEGYRAMADRMMELAAGQPGFLGVESARGADGLGITVSYWRDRESIRQWREHAQHQIAQRLGRDRWYAKFRLRICRVVHEYGFDAPEASASQKATEPERVGTADGSV